MTADGDVATEGEGASEPERPARTEVADEAPPAALCITLGAFAERREAEQLLQRLLALDVQAGLVEDDVVGSTDYWLVMPVSGGSVDAVARLSLLQEQGKLDEAESLCREAVEGFTEVLGPDHAHTKYAMSLLEDF